MNTQRPLFRRTHPSPHPNHRSKRTCLVHRPSLCNQSCPNQHEQNNIFCPCPCLGLSADEKTWRSQWFLPIHPNGYKRMNEEICKQKHKTKATSWQENLASITWHSLFSQDQEAVERVLVISTGECSSSFLISTRWRVFSGSKHE